ncbi:hypothetical protein CJ030_MR7G000719 [Morella rubra]|uniref:Amidase domain-containing protein n=1 Tax=Morella rubra TaxID=262757 RepID=A0A6A1V5I6_9ROSI|nr:hypothetical protein CJ030_MR7G000719 [Morella rubra]
MSQGTPACPSSCASTSASKRGRGRTRGDHFDLDYTRHEDVRTVVETMMTARRTHRNRMHAYFKKFPSKEAALLKPHPDTTEEQWKELCDLFTSEAFMKRSEQNKKNRSKLTVNHAAGSRSFQRTRACMKNQESGNINPAELYKKNYTNKDGIWTSEGAREIYERMDAFQRQCDLEGKTYTEIEVYSEILGKKSGYVRGLGRAHQLAKARDEIEAMRAAREKDLQEFAKKQAEMEATLRDHREEQRVEQERIRAHWNPCGSSSGSAISVAANLVAVSLATETDGSIICPSSHNSAVGIKPTVGLTSRAGVIPISPRQDTVGPICRTVSDVVYVLGEIVGLDYRDKATIKASLYIPHSGYKQFLKANGLKGKRLGIVRKPFFDFGDDNVLRKIFHQHLKTLSDDHDTCLEICIAENGSASFPIYLYSRNVKNIELCQKTKVDMNKYLKEVVSSPVRTLADVIAFNNKFSDLEKTKEYGQNFFLGSQATNGFGDKEKAALLDMSRLTLNGFVKVMKEHKLDALVTPGADFTPVLAIGGFPGISVPAGYGSNGVPIDICFGGLRGSSQS